MVKEVKPAHHQTATRALRSVLLSSHYSGFINGGSTESLNAQGQLKNVHSKFWKELIRSLPSRTLFNSAETFEPLR
jgi:hypothetical protein